MRSLRHPLFASLLLLVMGIMVVPRDLVHDCAHGGFEHHEGEHGHDEEGTSVALSADCAICDATVPGFRLTNSVTAPIVQAISIELSEAPLSQAGSTSFDLPLLRGPPTF